MPRQLPLMSRRLAFALVVMLLAAAAQARAQARAQTPAADATFTRDIAPILIDKCGTCHRPDGPGPFSLLTYADARARARLIADVTRSGYMPPWKPEPGHGALVGERRLTKEEIERIGRWVEGGARQGDPAAMPKLPHWPAGWQSGEPDLVLTLPEYEVPASRESVLNVFRNFAVAVPDIGTRHVRALEFRPGSSSVHHANIFVDRTTTSRRLDDDDPLPGYKGLIPHTAVFPEGHFLGWTPGQAPPLQQDAPTWRLEGGDNLLVQLHIEPTDQVLEVGSGSGYLTALLSHLAKHVTSVEIVPELLAFAEKNLAAHHVDNVTLVRGDAAQGWPGSYDVIVLTGSVPVLPPAFQNSLKPGGRLFAIVGDAPAMQATLLSCAAPGIYDSTILFETDVALLQNALQPKRFVF